LGCALGLGSRMMHSCGHHQRRHHGYGSSSNSPHACREREDNGVVACRPKLWEIATAIATASDNVVVASAIVSVAAIVECVLLLCRGVDVGWGLLADRHAELLDVC
jgi:hypothetical protein